MPFLPLRLAPLVLAATVALTGTATASVLVTVNKATQRMTVLVDGETRYSWPVSTGMKGYATPAGTFRPFRLEEEHYSKEWDDAPMPHSIFFTPAGHAIHGSNATRRLGSPASHGCIRIAPANAAKLFALVSAEGLSNTKVVVTGGQVGRVARGRTRQARPPRLRRNGITARRLTAGPITAIPHDRCLLGVGERQPAAPARVAVSPAHRVVPPAVSCVAHPKCSQGGCRALTYC